MADLDAAKLAQQAIRLALVTESQVQECWDELGQRGGESAPFIRILERKGYLTPWQSSKLLKGDVDGYFLGGYRKLYRIASGSFGRVFRADNPHTGEVVAIKVLRRRWSDKPHNIELFEREGRMGLSLNHPNIVRILAVSRDHVTNEYYIVMEFVEGGNLRDLLGIRGKLDPKEALRIIEESASGLTYAYSRGMTHRDIKLTNILISAQGPIKLVDFGLAGMEPVGGQEDDETKVDRTVDYAGLERATGVPIGDVRSDIFFLGCVLYEILTSRSPLAMSKDRRARMMKQRFSAVVPMTREEVEAPASVFRLVESMMALDPQSRYQTPAQLLEAVRQVRRELEGNAGDSEEGQATPRTVFVVESSEKLQDAIREKFKEIGYRVLISADPLRAVQRFKQQPFQGLVLDAGASGEEGLDVFRHLIEHSEQMALPCSGILILSQEQADWQERLTPNPRVQVLVRPVTMKQLCYHLGKLVPLK